MIVYFSFLLIALINIYLRNVWIFWITVFSVVLLTSFRFRIGTDWWVYEKLISSAQESYALFGLIEPISFVLLLFVGLFDVWGYEALCLIQGILLFGSFYVLRREPARFIGISVYLAMFMMPSFDIIRQSMAVSVFTIFSVVTNSSRFRLLRFLFSLGLHYSTLFLVVLNWCALLLAKVERSVLIILIFVPFLLFTVLGDYEIEFASKYGVFAILKPQLTLTIFLLVFLLVSIRNNYFLAFVAVLSLMFGFNIDIFYRMLFWTWPLFFTLRVNWNNLFIKYILVIFLGVIFIRNNTNDDVVDFRYWNGLSFEKSESDIEKVQELWQTEMATQL